MIIKTEDIIQKMIEGENQFNCIILSEKSFLDLGHKTSGEGFYKRFNEGKKKGYKPNILGLDVVFSDIEGFKLGIIQNGGNNEAT